MSRDRLWGRRLASNFCFFLSVASLLNLYRISSSLPCWLRAWYTCWVSCSLSRPNVCAYGSCLVEMLRTLLLTKLGLSIYIITKIITPVNKWCHTETIFSFNWFVHWLTIVVGSTRYLITFILTINTTHNASKLQKESKVLEQSIENAINIPVVIESVTSFRNHCRMYHNS